MSTSGPATTNFVTPLNLLGKRRRDNQHLAAFDEENRKLHVARAQECLQLLPDEMGRRDELREAGRRRERDVIVDARDRE